MSRTAFRCLELGAIASAGLIMGMTVRPLWVILLIIGLYVFADVMRTERILRTNEKRKDEVLMLIPLPLVTGLFEKGRTLFTLIASMAGAIAVWAQTHQERQPQDPVEELTERLRHPVRYFCKHPIRAIVRRVR